jgi:type II restriction/modification system DNA methylase subunit YeeA
MDAILARDENGGLREPEWPEVDVIVGNPPFLGGKRMRAELENGYVDDLFSLYDGRVAREADLVAYWFEKARAEIEQGWA